MSADEGVSTVTAEQTERRVLVVAVGETQVGTVIAGELAAAGHTVLLAISGRSPLESDCQRLTFDEDAADPEAEAAALFTQAGGVDTVILADVAPGEPCAVEALSSHEWEVALRRNARWSFLVGRDAAPVLRRAAAPRLVFLVPEQVRTMPGTLQAAYLSSKATVIGLTRAFALELGPDGITVNAVACPLPGPSPDSPPTRPVRTPELRDVAQTILFLLSPASAFITGSTLDVNGGRHML